MKFFSLILILFLISSKVQANTGDLVGQWRRIEQGCEIPDPTYLPDVPETTRIFSLYISAANRYDYRFMNGSCEPTAERLTVIACDAGNIRIAGETQIEGNTIKFAADDYQTIRDSKGRAVLHWRFGAVGGNPDQGDFGTPLQFNYRLILNGEILVLERRDVQLRAPEQNCPLHKIFFIRENVQGV